MSATEEGTSNYRSRFEGRIPTDHFRRSQGSWISSIGIGTYLGNHDSATDNLYRDAVTRSVELGSNVIDSAINYRLQRSERSIGAALKTLREKGIKREEIVVTSKGGFIPFDSSPPKDVRTYFDESFVKPGIANFSDVIAGCHCMTPSYLLNQLDSSLKNLGLECVDVYYVHNPETQLTEVARGEFNDRLLKAFEALEGAVAEGKIRMYGTATWNGYRNDLEEKEYMSLSEVHALALKAGGENHHFKAIQLPLNLAMHEALTKKNQEVSGEKLSTLEAAQRLNIMVMCSASILQGQLARNLPPVISEVFRDLETDAQRSLQFVRSTPGVTVALVGMKQLPHVEENLKVALVPPVPWEQYAKLFSVS
ncbi:MAG TPA: aldo/keto reductase [Candidatus Binatia bacterium]|nr:aldo/keto reductase [Candidatus Binatia bacterium]